MSTLPAAHAASNPLAYLNQFYASLQALWDKGGTAEEVQELMGGIVPALAASAMPRGGSIRVRVYPSPWGYDLDHVSDSGLRVERPEVSSDEPRRRVREIDEAFHFQGDTGLIYAGSQGRWQRWNPASGPAPERDDNRMRVKLVVLHDDSDRVTVVRFIETFGKDLPESIYKSGLDLAPATEDETAHLFATLRSLLTRAPSGVA